jgi:penicillin-binding protein 1A
MPIAERIKQQLIYFFTQTNTPYIGITGRAKKILAIKLFFEFALLFVLALEVNFLGLFGTSIPISKLKNPEFAIASEVYTADSLLIGKYYKENRSPVGFDKIDTTIIKALVATEDVRFYNHFGIDPLASLAVIYYSAQGDNRGGSTITQQLVKNLFKTRKSGARGLLGRVPIMRTVVYKAKEIITAIKIECLYSKNEIINMYLNTVDFGNNSFGIKVACRQYFNTSTDSLKIDQAATLVGMLKAPSNYNPLRKPQASLERRNVVLGQMLKYNIIQSRAYDSLVKLKLNISPKKIDNGNDDNGNYLRVAVSNYLRKWCKENNYDLYADGLKIYTTIDARLQHHAEEAVQEHMRPLQRLFDQHWKNQIPWRDENDKEIPNFIEKLVKRTTAYQQLKKKFGNNNDTIQALLMQPKRMKVYTYAGEKDTTFSSIDSLIYYIKFLNTGMMSFEPTTGYIKAWVGGINYKYFKYDHVKQMRRQAGSTFKPFAYVTAIDNGYSPCDKFVDRAVTINYVENGEKKTWSPHNSDWVFTGREMTLRRAMGKSVNSVTAQVTEKLGWDKVKEYAQKCGITSELKAVPSICLGSNDVSVWEMVGAYGTFLNKGTHTEPMLVTRIYNKKGELIHEFVPETKKVLSEETAWLMLHMFRGGIEEPGGTSQALWGFDVFKNGNEIGGKTGTSSNHSDGWYMGITSQYVTGVWVGASERSIHFRTSALGEGARTALPIFAKYVEHCFNDPKCSFKPSKFPKPFTKITKKYNCPTPWERTDTLRTDSLSNVAGELPVLIDSLGTE